MTHENVPEQFVDAFHERPLVSRRRPDDSDMDITPMIDITFLLLIFFIVAARLNEDTPVELPPARHGDAVALKSSVILTVANGSGESADIYVGDGKAEDRRLDGSNPEKQATAITDYVKSGIADGKEYVLIKAEGGVRHRDVARVSRAVGNAGTDLYIAVLEVR